MSELSAVCLYGLYGKLDTFLHFYYYKLLVLLNIYHSVISELPMTFCENCCILLFLFLTLWVYLWAQNMELSKYVSMAVLVLEA